MKKVLIISLTLLMLLSFCSCIKQRTSVSDYMYMYEGIVDDWNKQATPGHERDTLLGFGEYLYNSELILFPRETPGTLDEFYYYWITGIDVDGYAIYFTCRLSEGNYASFVDGLKNFKVKSGENEISPLYDTEHFDLPTYILQWTEVGDKWEVLEYIMLDDENTTAVFVYTMSELGHIEIHSDYRVTPSEMEFLDYNFSIYNNFENCTYDISFLEYLK